MLYGPSRRFRCALATPLLVDRPMFHSRSLVLCLVGVWGTVNGGMLGAPKGF
jgi:hypothetical protein